MSLTVLKPFPHPIRRFNVGDTISELDLVGGVIPLADLKKRKFVVDSDTKTAERAIEKAEPAIVDSAPLALPETATALEQDRAVMAREVDKPAKR
ncbi:hypothetical protein [EBPR siphovirus 3]|nr:hypothetical protein [EBPR siphovirus 3]